MALSLGQDLVEGTLVVKRNRFLAEAEVGGRRVFAHVPNSGRLAELLTPGRPALFSQKPSTHRKTPFTLELVRFNGRWVSINSNTPNALIGHSLLHGLLPPFSGFQSLQREHTRGNSRFDFLLIYPGGKECLVEVKSVTLVEGKVGMFPDAPTERGRKHLLELMHFARQGVRCAVLFCVQRSDAVAFAPNDGTDPEFGRILRLISKNGVEVHAYNCRVGKRSISLLRPIPVRIFPARTGEIDAEKR